MRMLSHLAVVCCRLPAVLARWWPTLRHACASLPSLLATAVPVLFLATAGTVVVHTAISARAAVAASSSSSSTPCNQSALDSAAKVFDTMVAIGRCWFAGPAMQSNTAVCPTHDTMPHYSVASMWLAFSGAIGVVCTIVVVDVCQLNRLTVRTVAYVVRAGPVAALLCSLACTAACAFASYDPTAPVHFLIRTITRCVGATAEWYTHLTTSANAAATAGAAAGIVKGYLTWFSTTSWTTLGAATIQAFASASFIRTVATKAVRLAAVKLGYAPTGLPDVLTVPTPDLSVAAAAGGSALRVAGNAFQAVYDMTADTHQPTPPPPSTHWTSAASRSRHSTSLPPTVAPRSTTDAFVDAISAPHRSDAADTQSQPSRSQPLRAQLLRVAARPPTSAAATSPPAAPSPPPAATSSAAASATARATAPPPHATAAAASPAGARTAAKATQPHGLATDAARRQLAAAQAVTPDEAASAARNAVATTRQLADATAAWWGEAQAVNKVTYTAASVPHHLRTAFAHALAVVTAGGPLMASLALGCALQPLTSSADALKSICDGNAANVIGVKHAKRDSGSGVAERNARVLRMIADGHSGDALDELHRPPARAIPAAELKAVIRELFPAAPKGDVPSVDPATLRDPTGSISTIRELAGMSDPADWRKHVAAAVRSCNAAAAPGVSGFRVRWLHDVLRASDDGRAPSDGRALSAVADFVDGLLGGGASCLLTTVRLVLIPKPAGKWRPLGVGEAFATVAKRVALGVLQPKLANYVSAAGQYTDESDGVAVVARAVATMWDRGWNVSTLDVRNAFNSVLRSRVLAAVRAHAPDVAPFIAACLAPTTLVTGVGTAETVERGVVQGDPLSSLLFNAALASVMNEWVAACAAQHGITAVLLGTGADDGKGAAKGAGKGDGKGAAKGARKDVASIVAAGAFDIAAVCYADDITVVWRDGARYAAALAALSTALAAAGLELRPDKTQCAPGRGVPIADVQAHLDAAAAGAADGATPTAQPAVMVLGVPVGDADAARAMMHDIIRDRTARLAALDTLDRPQATLAALRTCGLHTAIEAKLKALAPHVVDASTLRLVADSEDALQRLVLGPDGYAASTPEHRAALALPMRIGGWGLTRLASRGALVDGLWVGYDSATADAQFAVARSDLMATLAAAADAQPVRLPARPSQAERAHATAAARARASARDLLRRIIAWGNVAPDGQPAPGSCSTGRRGRAATHANADGAAAKPCPPAAYKATAAAGCSIAITARMSRAADYVMIGQMLGIDCLPADIDAERCPAAHGKNRGQQLAADGASARSQPVTMRDHNGVSHLEMCAVMVKHQRHNAAQQQMALEFQHTLNAPAITRCPRFKAQLDSATLARMRKPPPSLHNGRDAGPQGYVLLEGIVTPDGIPTRDPNAGAALGDVVVRKWGRAPTYVDLTWSSNFGIVVQKSAPAKAAHAGCTDAKRQWALANLTDDAAATVDFVPFGIATDGSVAPDARAALHGLLSDAAITRVVAAGLIAQATAIVALIAMARRKRADREAARAKATTATRARAAAAVDTSSAGDDDDDDDGSSSTDGGTDGASGSGSSSGGSSGSSGSSDGDADGASQQRASGSTDDDDDDDGSGGDSDGAAPREQGGRGGRGDSGRGRGGRRAAPAAASRNRAAAGSGSGRGRGTPAGRGDRAKPAGRAGRSKPAARGGRGGRG